jgi:hypothetical protein
MNPQSSEDSAAVGHLLTMGADMSIPKGNFFRVLVQGFLSLFLVALAGCGGGGGGGGSSAGTPSSTSPPAVFDTSGTVFGIAFDQVSGTPLLGAKVTAGGKTVVTGPDGSFSVKDLALGRTVVSVSAAGHADNSIVVNLNASQGRQRVKLPAYPTGMSYTFDSALAQVLADPSSLAKVTLPANAFLSGSGATPIGGVTAELTLLNDASRPSGIPGDYTTASGNLQAYGAVSIVFKDSAGNALNLAPGKSAKVQFPTIATVANLPASAQLFSFDAQAGRWLLDSTATLVGTAPNAYYEGTVSHFSSWLVGAVVNPIQVTGKVVDESGAAFAGVTVAVIGVDYVGISIDITDGAGNFSVPAKPNAKVRVLAYLNDAQTPEQSGTLPSTNYAFPSPFVLPRAAAARIELGVPTVLAGDLASGDCCRYFKVEVPFKTTGMEIKPVVHTDGTADAVTVNARWEFSSAVRLCDRPPIGVSGANCSQTWLNAYQDPPYLNPWNGYDNGGYLATKVGATNTTTAGTLGFQFSFHNAVFNKGVWVVILPTVSVTAVLAVTVVNPVTSTSVTVRSEPILVSY